MTELWIFLAFCPVEDFLHNTNSTVAYWLGVMWWKTSKSFHQRNPLQCFCSSERSIKYPTIEKSFELTRWAQILTALPPESFYTEWKTSPGHRRWETGHCSCTDTDCEDDVCPHKVTTAPSGCSFRSSHFSLQREKDLIFSILTSFGDLQRVYRYEIMWWCRSGLSYCMFVQGVVQYAIALDVLTSWEHTMCCDTVTWKYFRTSHRLNYVQCLTRTFESQTAEGYLLNTTQ